MILILFRQREIRSEHGKQQCHQIAITQHLGRRAVEILERCDEFIVGREVKFLRGAVASPPDANRRSGVG